MDVVRTGERIRRSAGFVVLTSAKGRAAAPATMAADSCRRCTAARRFAAPAIRCSISRTPAASTRKRSAASLDALNRLNDLALQSSSDPEIAARIQSYELAYRLQTSAPELMDLSKESPATLEKYGIKIPQRSQLRPQLPAGSSARRTRRSLRPAVPRSLGSARQPDGRSSSRTPSTPIKPAPRS